MPAQGHFPGAAGPSPAPGYQFRGLKPASRRSLALAAGQDYRPKGRFSGRSKPLAPSRRCKLARRSLLILFVAWRTVAEKRTRLKYADQSKGSGFEQAPSRAFCLIRYAAVRPALLPNGKRGNPGLRPAQANGQQSKYCMPSVSLRSTLFASMAVCNSHSKRFVLFPTTGNEYQEAF